MFLKPWKNEYAIRWGLLFTKYKGNFEGQYKIQKERCAKSEWSYFL